MKKRVHTEKIVSGFALAAVFAFVSPLCAQLTDVYWGPGDWEPESSGNSPWYYDSAHVNRAPTSLDNLANYNLIFDGYKNTGENGDTVVYWGRDADKYTIGGVVVTGGYTGAYNRFGQYNNAVVELNIKGDFKVIDNYTSEPGDAYYSFAIANGIRALNVGGNYVVQNSQAWIGSPIDTWNDLDKVAIGKNIELQGQFASVVTPVGYFANLDKGRVGTFENPNLVVDGIINMQAEKSRWFYSHSEWPLQSYSLIGGLNGKGVVARTGGDCAAVATIGFNVAAGKTYDFKGTLSNQNDYNPTEDRTAVLNIEMRGKGTQILRLEREAYSYFTDDVDVYDGTLAMGMWRTTLDVAGKLTLHGGNFTAAAETAPDDGGQDIGVAFFKEIVWDGGKILVDMESAYNMDVISADSFVGSAEVFEFVFNYSGDWADLDGIKVYDFFDVGGLTDEMVAKFLISDSRNRYQGWIEGSGGDYAFKFAAVPEPAAVAVLAAVFAMAFAAYRRRK